MPATELKIDKSFIAAMAGGPRHRILVRSTIAMAHELGLEVVAEGVEAETALSLLRDMACDQAQGYMISRPLRADAVAEFVRRERRRGGEEGGGLGPPPFEQQQWLGEQQAGEEAADMSEDGDRQAGGFEGEADEELKAHPGRAQPQGV